MISLLVKIKSFLLVALRFYRITTMVSFSESDLQRMKFIEEKAISEAQKKINKGLANHKDIIEMVIRDKKVVVTEPTKHKVWKEREKIAARFIKDSLAKYPRDINLKINIGLHDAYCESNGLLVFSLLSRSRLNILIPDFYAMLAYRGNLYIKDRVEFDKKKDQAIFIGSSTGSVSPYHNDRLQLCNYFLKSEKVKCYINNVCQIEEDKIAEVFPAYKAFLHESMNIPSQLAYKFIITIDGNTASWDRLVWILNSNSVCLKKKSDHVCWYYDFLENGKHYIEFNEFDEIEKIMETVTPEQCEEIIKNANAFVKQYLTYDKQLAYMGHLLYYCSIGKT
jgi:hypothetical protein